MRMVYSTVFDGMLAFLRYAFPDVFLPQSSPSLQAMPSSEAKIWTSLYSLLQKRRRGQCLFIVTFSKNNWRYHSKFISNDEKNIKLLWYIFIYPIGIE